MKYQEGERKREGRSSNYFVVGEGFTGGRVLGTGTGAKKKPAKANTWAWREKKRKNGEKVAEVTKNAGNKEGIPSGIITSLIAKTESVRLFGKTWAAWVSRRGGTRVGSTGSGGGW